MVSEQQIVGNQQKPESNLEDLQHAAPLFACHRGAGEDGVEHMGTSRALGQSQKLWSSHGTQTPKYKSRVGKVQQTLQ